MEYIYYKELQDLINRYYQETGKPLSFAAAMQLGLDNGITHKEEIPLADFTDCALTDLEAINRIIDQLTIPYSQEAIHLESDKSLGVQLIVFKYPEHSRAGIHVQNGLELNYVCSGSCTLFFEGREYQLMENEVVIVPPNTAHDVYNTEGSLVFSFLVHQDVFNESFFQVLHTDTALATFYDMILYRNARSFLSFQLEHPRIFLSTFLSLYAEAYSLKQYRYEICIDYIRILFAELLRQPKPTFKNDSLDEVQILLQDMPVILRYIQRNYLTVSLGALAEMFHYDRSYLGKQIKKYTNISFSDMVTQRKLEHAYSLLTTTKLSMEVIAEQSGYQSADHFSRMFKKSYGCSPSEYRKQHSSAE